MVTRAEQKELLVAAATRLADALEITDKPREDFMARENATPLGGNADAPMPYKRNSEAPDPLQKATADLAALADAEIPKAKAAFERAEALMGTPGDVAAVKWKEVAEKIAAAKSTEAARDVMDAVNWRTGALDAALPGAINPANEGKGMGSFVNPADVTPEVKAKLKALAEQDGGAIAQFDVDTGLRGSVNGAVRTEEQWRAKIVQTVSDPVYLGSISTTNTVVDAKLEREKATAEKVEKVEEYATVVRMPDEVKEKLVTEVKQAQEKTPGAAQRLQAGYMQEQTDAAKVEVATVESKAESAGLNGRETWDKLAATIGSMQNKIRDMRASVSEIKQDTQEWVATPTGKVKEKVTEILEKKPEKEPEIAATPKAPEIVTMDAKKLAEKAFRTDLEYQGGNQYDTPVKVDLKEKGQKVALTNIKDIGDSMVEIRSKAGDFTMKADDLAGGKSNVAGYAADPTRYVALLSEDRTRSSGKATIELTDANLKNIKTITKFEDKALGGERIIIEYNNGKKTDIRAEKVQLALPEKDGKPGTMIAANMDDVRKARGEDATKAIAAAPAKANGPAKTGTEVGFIPLQGYKKDGNNEERNKVAKVFKQTDGKFVTDRIVGNGKGVLISGNTQQAIKIEGGVNVYSAAPAAQTPAGKGGTEMAQR